MRVGKYLRENGHFYGPFARVLGTMLFSWLDIVLTYTGYFVGTLFTNIYSEHCCKY
jgi:hypothetical protein